VPAMVVRTNRGQGQMDRPAGHRIASEVPQPAESDRVHEGDAIGNVVELLVNSDANGLTSEADVLDNERGLRWRELNRIELVKPQKGNVVSLNGPVVVEGEPTGMGDVPDRRVLETKVNEEEVYINGSPVVNHVENPVIDTDTIGRSER